MTDAIEEMQIAMRFYQIVALSALAVVIVCTGCETNSNASSRNRVANGNRVTLSTNEFGSTEGISASETPPTFSNNTLSSLQAELQLLQAAVRPASAESAADTWARAIQARNGALQFAILTPALQNDMRKTYIHLQWTTGLSSPHVSRYQVKDLGSNADGTRKFQITYFLTDSAKDTFSPLQQTIAVKQLDDHTKTYWLVSSVPTGFLSNAGGLEAYY